MDFAQKNDLKKLRERFHEVWPILLADIRTDPSFEDMPEAAVWLDKIMKRNVPKGKQNRAMALITFYRHLLQDLTPEEEHLNYIAGWITEIGQAAALMADDIMDGSETRRGEKCWYKETDIGMSAVNDALLLENITHFILYKYFSEKEYFQRLLSLAHDILLKTIMGQSIDTRFALEFKFNECTLAKYNRIVTYKTSYYTFYHPYACALVAAGIKDESLYAQVKEISLDMGYLFQAQDDYLDLYGNTKMTGKVGTDIIDRKCTWLLVKALENATQEQKRILKICYGSRIKEDEENVKIIYKDLKVKQLFRAFEKKSYEEIGDKIMSLPPTIPQAPLLTLLNAIYRRNK